jgi:hypothetical protein
VGLGELALLEGRNRTDGRHNNFRYMKACNTAVVTVLLVAKERTWSNELSPCKGRFYSIIRENQLKLVAKCLFFSSEAIHGKTPSFF